MIFFFILRETVLNQHIPSYLGISEDKLEDTKAVTKIRKSRKDTQPNCRKKKDNQCQGGFL